MSDRIPGSNIVLIGMPGAGKSTVGVMLAKRAAIDFIDTDVQIQVVTGHSLQHILEEDGHLGLRSVEEKIILAMDCWDHVVATGGSVAYSERSMHHLKERGSIVFLDVDYKTLVPRVRDLDTRGIARRPDQSFRDVFDERRPLYQRYADVVIKCGSMDQDTLCDEILSRL